MSLVGRVFSNRYEIQRELAQGGMAEVYLARDQLLDRPVALKALFPEYAREPSFVERFRREAQAAANLNHPNIVAIYDWGQETGTYFIVMEYVEGRSLRDLIRSDGPLEANQAAEITAEIGSALAFAHRGGVVHRDVKPGNVLLTRTGLVKVTDFGIARAGTSDSLTQTGSVMGTATYFSPEQAQGLPVDGRSDVYSLGVVLYEMVTGVPPFTGDSPVSVAYKHVREEVVPPTRRNPDVPPALEQVILTALAKDPDLRYQTADDMRADLLRFRRGRPLAAVPVTALVAEVGTGATAGAGPATMVTPSIAAASTTTNPPAHRGRRRGPLAAIITILVLLLAVAAVIGISQLAGSDATKKIVADVTGKTATAAREILENDGFKVKARQVASTTVEQGFVADQDPAPNERADEGSRVTIDVSTGSGEIEMPNVVGQPQQTATDELRDLGLNVDVQSEYSADVPSDRVIRTSPSAGVSVQRGDRVQVVVSFGKEPVEVPNVEGTDYESAAATLTNAGFQPIRRSQASETVDEGQVIRTDPAAGESVVPGQVQVYVSSGRATTTLPDVRGKTKDNAINQLHGAGFQNVSVIFDVSTPGNNGKVIAMSPDGNTQQTTDITVVITVGQSTTTSTSGASTTTTSGP